MNFIFILLLSLVIGLVSRGFSERPVDHSNMSPAERMSTQTEWLESQTQIARLDKVALEVPILLRDEPSQIYVPGNAHCEPHHVIGETWAKGQPGVVVLNRQPRKHYPLCLKYPGFELKTTENLRFFHVFFRDNNLRLFVTFNFTTESPNPDYKKNPVNAQFRNIHLDSLPTGEERYLGSMDELLPPLYMSDGKTIDTFAENEQKRTLDDSEVTWFETYDILPNFHGLEVIGNRHRVVRVHYANRYHQGADWEGDELYFHQDEGEVKSYMVCDKSRCEHTFYYPPLDAMIDTLYSKKHLADWRHIEEEVQAFVARLAEKPSDRTLVHAFNDQRLTELMEGN